MVMMTDVGCTDEIPIFGTRNWHNLSDIHGTYGTKFVKTGLAVEAGFNVRKKRGSEYTRTIELCPVSTPEFPFLFYKNALSTVMYVLVCTDFAICGSRKGAQNLVF